MGNVFNTRHIRKRLKVLKLSASNRVKLSFSKVQGDSMRMLWLRFRHYASKKGCSLGDLYKEAFSKFLSQNKIPKLIPKIERSQRDLMFDDETVEMVNSLRKIALKRNQPLAIVIEQALQEYLDMPENYLGMDMQKPGHVERIG